MKPINTRLFVMKGGNCSKGETLEEFSEKLVITSGFTLCTKGLLNLYIFKKIMNNAFGSYV